MFRRLLILVALLGVACTPALPGPPATRSFNVRLVDAATNAPLDGAVTANGTTLSVHWQGEIPRLADCPTPLIVTVSAPGYQPFARTYTAADVACEYITATIALTPLAPRPPPVTSAGESGPLHTAGQFLERADGSIWRWVGASDFALFQRWNAGEDIGPILDERIALRFKVLRVFGMFDRFGIGGASGLGALTPTSVPNYYTKIRAFVDVLAARGLRVEWVVLADADGRSDGTGGLLPTVAQQQAHLSSTLAALAGAWNIATVEWANEPFKNAAHVAELQGDCPALGLICSYGIETLDFGQTSMPHLQVVTIHDHDRGEEWPRHGKAIDELRNGFDWYDGDLNYIATYSGVHVPTIWDEPMGAAEADDPGRRFTNADEGREAAATAALFGAGSTFHSDDGVASRLFRPIEKAAAKAWVEGATWPPADAQASGYQRGGDCGSAGIGAMPIQHCDIGTPNAASTDLRAFCKVSQGFEWCARIRPTGPTVPRSGWAITNEPKPGLVQLRPAA